MKELLKIAGSIRNLAELKLLQIADLQKLLSMLAYPVGHIDGILGEKTYKAFADFKKNNYLSYPELIGISTVNLLIRQAYLYDAKFNTKKEVKESIKNACRRFRLKKPEQIAYIFATVDHETASTWEPVKEAYWNDEIWRKEKLRYYPYYGRGYVQLTWKHNYSKYTNLLGIDFVNEPDLALQPIHALYILIHGFKTGIFTGAKIEDFINDQKVDFIKARLCINGTDKTESIARIAESYLDSAEVY